MTEATLTENVETVLERFVDKDGLNYSCGYQWVKGGWRVATDARIMARLKTDEPDFQHSDEDGHLEKPPNAHAVFSHYAEDFEKHDQFKPVEMRTCDACNCTGRMEGECKDCGGDGRVTCFECGHEHACEECGGSGNGTLRCSKCEHVLVAPEEWIDIRYWYMIQSLPAVTMYKQDRQSLFQFSVNGCAGQGIVMHRQSQKSAK